ncbi:class Ib ribonucleoside-diphosphate reductase assembly flavoprotein NrdI [Cohnella sp. CFH 77786]|nr:class Ib ribonucleoside-diphosphate reductase assembly flavoprotein NrdI [Cohnella sp. CFH 77786]MBW5446970.1 class Ib ribonucleoside-diphosphate reductase assembly flavoprotein NrdI [Cohnella sp. CFH 77786]
MVVYDSLTGNVQRFVRKLGCRNVKLDESLRVHEPFVLVTYTIGNGQAPLSTLRFLQENSRYLIAVASSGNRNWGSNYARAAHVISTRFSVPVLHTFELAGTEEDVEQFLKEADRYGPSHSQMDRAQ